MMLKIGNKRVRGFTLVEIMVTTAVLSLGIVSVYQSLFICLDTLNYCADYLNVLPQVNEKVWLSQDALQVSGPTAQLETEGKFIHNRKNFDWSLSYVLVDESDYLYQITLDVGWKAGRRAAGIQRNAYAKYEQEETK